MKKQCIVHPDDRATPYLPRSVPHRPASRTTPSLYSGGSRSSSSITREAPAPWPPPAANTRRSYATTWHHLALAPIGPNLAPGLGGDVTRSRPGTFVLSSHCGPRPWLLAALPRLLSVTGSKAVTSLSQPPLGTADYKSGSLVLIYALTEGRRTGEPRGKSLSR
jgi:hypothetical protein